MVARKNVRDFRGGAINPRDHFVLPDKRRLSRNDASELLSKQQFWVDNPRIVLIPQLLRYMVSPYKGAPAVAGKVRGGGFVDQFLQAGDDETGSKRTTAPERDGEANIPPWKRGGVVHERLANNTNMSIAPPHTATTSNDPAPSVKFNSGPSGSRKNTPTPSKPDRIKFKHAPIDPTKPKRAKLNPPPRAIPGMEPLGDF